MSDTPYQAPKSELEKEDTRSILGKISALEIKDTYVYSNRLQYLGVLFFIFGLILLVPFIVKANECISSTNCQPVNLVAMLLFSFFFLSSGYFCFKRSLVGKYTIAALCIPILFMFPIGTIAGFIGLRAIYKSPVLFGENKVTHNELKQFMSTAYN